MDLKLCIFLIGGRICVQLACGDFFAIGMAVCCLRGEGVCSDRGFTFGEMKLWQYVISLLA